MPYFFNRRGAAHLLEKKDMSATTSFQSEVLRHILLNESLLGLGDTAGLLPSAAAGDVFVCLLSQAPGEAGDLTNEAAWGGYARVAVPRSAAGWTENNAGQARNFAAVNFPECTGGVETDLYFGICKTLAGDDMIYHGELPEPAFVSIEVQPQFGPNTLEINLD